MKALDFVKTPKGQIALITETNGLGKIASIIFIGGDKKNEKNAWWDKKDLEVLDSLPRLLSAELAHPFGTGKEDVKEFFKIGGEHS